MPQHHRYLDTVALAKLGSLQLRARYIVEGALSGLHHGPHRGSSVEFAEHKEYSPGDDIRHVDWKALGRVDRYYVKQFERETELRSTLVLDASGSMAYGGHGPSKFTFASYLCAALAHLLLHQQDQVSLLTFGGGGAPRYLPPRSHPSHLPDLLAAIESTQPAGPTALAAALSFLSELTRRRGLVVLLSDLFDPSPQVADTLRALRAFRHDIVLFHILDGDELRLPFEGLTMFESLEDQRRLLADPADLRQAYEGEIERFITGYRRGCAELGIEYRLVDTCWPLDRVLLEFLRGRLRRTRGSLAAATR